MEIGTLEKCDSHAKSLIPIRKSALYGVGIGGSNTTQSRLTVLFFLLVLDHKYHGDLSLASSIYRLSVPSRILLVGPIHPTYSMLLMMASLICRKSEPYCWGNPFHYSLKPMRHPLRQSIHGPYWSSRPIQQLQHVLALQNGNWCGRPTAHWWNQSDEENLFVEYDNRNCVDTFLGGGLLGTSKRCVSRFVLDGHFG